MLSPDLHANGMPAAPDGTTNRGRRRSANYPRLTARRWLLVVVASVLAFVAVVVLRAAGALTGWAYLLVLGVMLLLIPTSRYFSQRVLLSVVGLAGTAPIMWWVTGPLDDLNRGSAVLGAAAAALVGSGTYKLLRRQPLRTQLPQFHAVDVLPLAAATASLWVVQNFIRVRSAEQSLLLLTQSWDFAPHFNMYNMIRTHGSVIALLPAAPDGGPWSAATYPQGFHSLMATLAEVAAGTSTADVGQELVLFCRLIGVVGILGTLLVVAGLTSLPVLRHNFLVSLPLVTIVATAWIVGPGAIPVFGAFPNFGLGVALCVACVAVVQMRRVIPPALGFGALILALIGVAHGWILLLVLCLPSVLVYGWHLLQHRTQLTKPVLGFQFLVGFLGLGALGAAIWQLRSMTAGAVLTTTGGIDRADSGVAIMCITMNAFVALAFYSRRKVGSTEARHGTLTSLHVLATPLFASVLLLFLGIFQLVQSGAISYYFYKSFLAVEILAIVCTVIGAAELWSPFFLQRHRGKTFVAASLLTSLGATQFFGLPVTALDEQGLQPTAQGSVAEHHQSSLLAGGMPPMIHKMIQISQIKQDRTFIYVGFNDFFDPLLFGQWSLSLQGKWTNNVEPALPMARPMYEGPSKVPEAIIEILRSLPDVDVAVDRELVAELRGAFPEYAARIITY